MGTRMALQQVRMGKLHLIKREGDKYLTACGIPLSWQHMAQPTDEVWMGPDKCRKCLHSLEHGNLGAALEHGHNPIDTRNL